MKKIKIAVIGLGFGYHFAKIYANHPNVEKVIVVDLTERRVKSFLKDSEYTGKTITYESFDDVLKDESIDAVHVCTGIDSHATLTIKVLNAGKHCACAVPMATSIEDIKAIVEAARKNNRKYMMMETTLYGTHLLRTIEMYERGELGKVQHMRGIHYQPMDDGYWNTNTTGPYW